MGRYYILACTLALILALAGCSSGDQTAFSKPEAGLPTLPEISGAVDVVTPPKGSSEIVDVPIPGSDYYAKSDSALVVPAGMELAIGANGSGWAVYELPNIAADYYPIYLELQVDSSVTGYYVALANYQQGRWQFQPGAVVGDQVIDFNPATWEKYASPTNSMFFAVVSWETPLVFEEATFTVVDNRPLPAPTGLTAEALDGAVQLTWDAYPDQRADLIQAYISSAPDMEGAVLAFVTDVANVEGTVLFLVNGTPYYFAIRAYRSATAMQSAYSNIVDATPHSSGVPPELSGIWPRKGNMADNCGCTTALGPPDLKMFVSAAIAGERHTVENRTSPVISSSGRIYSLTGDGVLVCLSSDLSTTYWEFAASVYGTEDADYVCPPHSPILDNLGQAYFIAATATPGALSYLFCVDSVGGMVWRYDLGVVDPDVSMPYPTPLITPTGYVAVVSNERHMLDAVGPTGEREWRCDSPIGPAVEVFADPALSPRGTIEMPVWRSGIGIPENVIRWLSVDATDGISSISYRGMGVKENIFGGLVLGSDYHVYPEQENVNLLDATSAILKSSVTMSEESTAGPARNLAGNYLFQPHAQFGIANTAYLVGIKVNPSEPPQISQEFAQQLGNYRVSGQPAVDGEGNIFCADTSGMLYRIAFDPGKPIGIDNPSISDQNRLDPSDKYLYNSIALSSEEAYIVSEQNNLYCVYNPLD